MKTCTKVASERKGSQIQLGDEGYDETEYGVNSKPFHSVVDFARRFNTLPRRETLFCRSYYTVDQTAIVARDLSYFMPDTSCWLRVSFIRLIYVVVFTVF